MFRGRADGLRRILPATKLIIAALCVPLVLAGCGTQWFTRRVEVDTATVDEVRGIGNVVTQTIADPIYEGTVEVTAILIMDVGAGRFQEAHDVALNRLRQRGWTTASGGDTDSALMKSAKWKDVILKIGRFRDFEEYGATLEPKIDKVLHGDSAKSDTYVIVALSPYKE
ncbi:hypothetical protein [Nonomuraea sp. NPDC049141]|uniref:hypothetical protein n=1 Tax=Nonomuraea sp. NPDC049141 TaxID=3155500 RepID=UPI0033FF51FD